MKNKVGRLGKPLSTYLPKRLKTKAMHFDPEFDTFTYGDPTGKGSDLLKLERNDLLVFYAGLTPFQTKLQKEALYIISYFAVEKVIDFSILTKSERIQHQSLYPNNAHMKRDSVSKDLVMVIGNKRKSKLLEKAILISRRGKDRIGRSLHIVSYKMEKLLGISGSIQRSKPIRFIKERKNLENLQEILNN